MNYIDELARYIYSAAEPNSPPDGWIEDAALYRLYAVLLLTKGTDVTNEDVHNAWSAWACESDALHPSLIPFDELKPRTQTLDEPYTNAIRRVAAIMISNGVL